MAKDGKKQVTLGQDDQLELTQGGVKVVFNAGAVSVFKNDIQVYHAANENALQPQSEPSSTAAPWTKETLDKIEDGEEYPDGTVRFGKALTLKDGFYRAAMPQDAARWMNHRDAQAEAKKLVAHGHNDFTLPNSDEGYALYAARDAGKLKDTFTQERGYWLAGHSASYALVQWFDDGLQNDYVRYDVRPVRCVRRFTI